MTATTTFNGSALKAWRSMVGLSQVDAGNVLGYERRQIQKMERDPLPLRNCVALACAAYALGIRSYDGPDIMAKLEQQRKKR